MINRLKAHELAAAANVQYVKGQEAEAEKNKNEKYKDTVWNRMKGTYASLKTILYVLLVCADSFVMYKILEIVVTDGMQLGSQWAVFFLGVYIIMLVSFTLEIAKGLGKRISLPIYKLEIDLEQLASPEVPSTSIEAEIKRISIKDYKRAMKLMIGLTLFLFLLALVRNYYVHQLQFQFLSPTDWINLLLPPSLGLLMSYMGIYKGMLSKYYEYKAAVSKYSKRADEFYLNAEEKGKEAIAYELQAVQLYEATERSKDLEEVLNRYSTHSMLDTHKHRVTLNLKRRGFPVPNKQISGFTTDNSAIFSVTDVNGNAILNWNGESYLVTILVERSPLNGTKFESGQLISIDLDSLLPPSDPRTLN